MNQQLMIKKIGHGGIKSLVKKAIQLGITVQFFLCEQPLIKFKLKGKSVFIRKGTIPMERRMGDMTRNKNLTKILLREIGIKTPHGIIATSFKEALSLIKKNNLSYPLIVKPLDGSLAKGVTWDIQFKNELGKAISILEKNKSLNKYRRFMVEEMFIGDEFRILVVNKRVISCVKKIPASILGDGHSTIKKLIASFNKTRLKGFKIKIDNIVEETLKKNKLTLESVLPNNFNLKLRNNLNMSDGGRSIECTDEMAKYFKQICENAIEILGLTFGGIDFMTKNISNKKSPYVILEVNPNPFYNMHEKPLVEGNGVDVSYEILKNIFPKLK